MPRKIRDPTLVELLGEIPGEPIHTRFHKLEPTRHQYMQLVVHQYARHFFRPHAKAVVGEHKVYFFGTDPLVDGFVFIINRLEELRGL